MASYNKGSFDYLSKVIWFPWTPPVYPLSSQLVMFDLLILFAGKMQHSVWVAEVVNCIPEVASTSLSDVVPAGVLPKQFSFRRIWQGKGAQTSASKVSIIF